MLLQWNAACSVWDWQLPGSEMTPSHNVGFFSGADPTKITQGPVDMEIIVGESIVLPCQVASDPVLDVSFSWAFNGQLITKGDSHFELVGGVSDRSHTSWGRAKWQLAPLPILLHFIPSIRLKRQLVVWHHGIIMEKFTVASFDATEMIPHLKVCSEAW